MSASKRGRDGRFVQSVSKIVPELQCHTNQTKFDDIGKKKA